jgi:small subunit ribosomal protein S6
MKKYEFGLLVSSELDEENLTQLLNKVSQWITDGSGQVLKMDNWGKRKLAYPIRKFRDGCYIFVQAEMEPRAVIEMERNLNISEAILRHIVIRLDE